MLVESYKESQRAALGESGEDYLEAVLLLARENRAVRVRDIARRLKVSKPSVVSALAGLETRGFLRHERYGGVELTGEGERRAESVYLRHETVFEFLHTVLGVNERVAAVDACRLEHALSPASARQLRRFVERQASHRAGRRGE